MKYKVVFLVGNTRLTVIRHANSDLSALNDAKDEGLKIAQKEQPNIVRVISVTQVK